MRFTSLDCMVGRVARCVVVSMVKKGDGKDASEDIPPTRGRKASEAEGRMK